jgi:hypothetical protein
VTYTIYDHEIPKELILVAELDESQSYEVDITKIYFNTEINKWVLAIASGCSCWEGDYEVEEFDTLAELGQSMIQDDRQYNPSFRGANELLQQAQSSKFV